MRECHPRGIVDPSDANHRTFAFVPNSSSGDLTVMNADTWGLVNLDPANPGYNRLPLGVLPSQISASDDGCRLVTANHGSCDLSVVDPSALLAPTLTQSSSVGAVMPTGTTVVATVVPRAKNSGRELRLFAGEVQFLPQATEAQTKGEQLCDPGQTWQALATFPSCDLVAVIDLPSGLIQKAAYARKKDSGGVELVPLADGEDPVCPVSDCLYPPTVSRRTAATSGAERGRRRGRGRRAHRRRAAVAGRPACGQARSRSFPRADGPTSASPTSRTCWRSTSDRTSSTYPPEEARSCSARAPSASTASASRSIRTRTRRPWPTRLRGRRSRLDATRPADLRRRRHRPKLSLRHRARREPAHRPGGDRVRARVRDEPRLRRHHRRRGPRGRDDRRLPDRHRPHRASARRGRASPRRDRSGDQAAHAAHRRRCRRRPPVTSGPERDLCLGRACLGPDRQRQRLPREHRSRAPQHLVGRRDGRGGQDDGDGPRRASTPTPTPTATHETAAAAEHAAKPERTSATRWRSTRRRARPDSTSRRRSRRLGHGSSRCGRSARRTTPRR